MRIFALLALWLAADGIPGQAANLTVKLEISPNIKGTGRIYCALFEEKFAKAFPGKVQDAYAKTSAIPTDNKGVCTFEKVPDGYYAVTAYYDQNNNTKLDKRFWGMPKEAWGISNNVRSYWRKPSFQSARFMVTNSTREIAIVLK
jgi:uncharacterized protein (DUF2141 family)